MPLSAACRNAVSKQVFVLPYYGYGWSRIDTGAPPETRVDVLGPDPFYLRIEEGIFCQEEMMGISGVITKSQNALNGYWCCCLLRNTDERDFTARSGEFIVCIAKRKLEILPEPYPKKALGDWIVADKTVFCWGGYGTVAESIEWVKEIYDRTMRGREEAKLLMKQGKCKR